MVPGIRVVTYSPRLATALVAAGLFAAACGGGSSSHGAANAGAKPVGAHSADSSSTAVTVATHTGPLGAYLTDASGRTLYMFAADKGSTSTCYGTCATFWPPLTASTPQAAGSAQMSMVATTTRTGGVKQVTYAGHPLYYFAKDTKPGDMLGQGLNASGGLWWTVSPNGSPITRTVPAVSTSSPASSGGGWA